MLIGVPSEIKDHEYRVALTPGGVKELLNTGNSVIIQKGAGEGSSISDKDFTSQGAKIVGSAKEVWSQADMVMKVKEPIASEYEFLGLKKDQILFTYLHLAASLACTEALVNSGNTSIAYETVRLANNSLPLLTPMSEVAGRMAPLMGAYHLRRSVGGRGTLICGVPGVPAANVVVLGAGVAGMAAATLAVGMQANVTIFDRNLERLREVDHHFRGAVQTLASIQHAIEESVKEADIVIGAVLVVGARAPKLVTDDMVATMKPGSVLVDISVDQGGCFESTRPTTHSEPTFKVHNSLFYCVANMPGAYPNTSTHALANATLPYAIEISRHGWQNAVRADPALAEGVNIVNGNVTYEPVAQAHAMNYRPLADILD